MPFSGLSSAHGWHRAHPWRRLSLPNRDSKITFHKRELHPRRKRDDWKLNTASPHTWSRTISAFLLLPPLSCLWPFLAGIAPRICSLYTASQGGMPCHTSQKNTDTAQPCSETDKEKRSGAKLVRPKQQNDTEVEWDKEWKVNKNVQFKKICDYKQLW